MPAPTATELEPEAAARIAARYPARGSTRRLVIVGALLLAVLVVWVLWAGLHRAQPGVHGQLFSYQVVSPTQIDVELRVHRPDPARPASCTVQAQAPSGETVGELDLPIAPDAQQDVQVKASVKTYLKAHTAIVTACRLT